MIICEDLNWHGNGLRITRCRVTLLLEDNQSVDEGFWWVVQFRRGGFLYMRYPTWAAALDGAQRYLAMEAQ